MQHQYSAGIIVYRLNEHNKPLYLLLQYNHGHWDFSKGHLEKDETNKEAAIRELKEETGLTAELLPGFQEQITYWFMHNEIKIFKTVTFFLGNVEHQEVILSCEHTGFSWLPYAEAIDTLTYDNAREVLTKADLFLD